jgi:hypothetical protein
LLPLLLLLTGVVAAGCSGSKQASPPTATVRAPPPPPRRHAPAPPPPTPAQRALGLPSVGPGPVPGYVLIADRNNDRILLVSPSKRILWRFPRPGDLRPGQSFHDPDDAFFAPGYRTISTNEEYNQAISLIALRSHRIAWSYGHAGVRGSAPGYLSNPDDAYVLPSGVVMVADIENCRVLFIGRSHRVVREIGHAGSCGHDPPRSLSSPNGATPLRDGGVLVTEIGGWVDRLDARGRLRYQVRTPTTYPSDAQLLPNGNILVAGFNTPGRVDVITPSGRIVWSYGPSSGPGALDRPSLAVRWPNGMIAVTDDWHHRVVVIDPRTKRIVWQYGHLGVASSAPGYLSKPDGLDLLPARAIRVPLRASASSRPTRSRLGLGRIGTLPEPLSRAAAVALPGGRVVVLGGLAGGSSTDAVLAGSAAKLRAVGRLPVPTHDAAAALVGGKVLLFGGGEAVSTRAIVSVDPRTGAARPAGQLDEPLSDLGAVSIGGRAYLVGGYTGSRYATAILRYDGGGRTTVVARLPSGTRYAGVAAAGGTIYVAGGLTQAGPTAAVFAVDTGTGSVRRVATLPRPLDHAAAAVLGRTLYVIGGRIDGGAASARVLEVDVRSGRITPVRILPRGLADPAAVVVRRQIVVIGGEGSADVLGLAPLHFR